MTLRSIFEGIGDFFQWTFGILESIGMAGNIFFIIIMTVMGIYWIGQMFGHQSRGES